MSAPQATESSTPPDRDPADGYGSPKGGSIIGLPQTLAVVFAAISLAFLLIPRETELVERLVEDGHHDRARQVAFENSDGEEDFNAEELIETLLENAGDSIDPRSGGRIAALIEIGNDPLSIRDMLAVNGPRFTDNGYARCLASLAMRSVQLNEPELGAEIYHELWALEPPDEARLMNTVAACRYAGRPDQALAAITRYLEENQQEVSRLPHNLRMTTVSLYRELNEGSRAFDLLSSEFNATMEPGMQHRLMELMTVTATESERLEDCVPLVADYLATLDASHRTWRELLKREQPDPGDADFLKYGAIIARHHEWRGRSEQAFEIYRKQAALGDIAALDRCVTIYPWIARQNDATDLLIALAPVEGRPQYTLLTARFEADRGNLERALELMEPMLATAPAKVPSEHPAAAIEQAASWLEFASILDEMGRYEEAVSAYRKANELDPTNGAPLKRSARLLIALGRSEAALEALSELPADRHDTKSLEDYAMLSGALGDLAAEEKALTMRLERNAEHPTPSDHQDISDLWLRHGDHARAIEAARAGVAALPDSRVMLLHLVDLLVETGNPEAALELVRRRDDPADSRFSSRLLDIAGTTSNPHQVLAMIEQRPPAAVWTPGQRLDLASFYEQCERREAALAIYREVDGGEADADRIEAELAYARGDPGAAVIYQRRYLKRITEPDYEGWMFLGDLYGAAGDSAAARNAYQQALDILRGNFKSTSRTPASPDNRLGEALVNRR